MSKKKIYPKVGPITLLDLSFATPYISLKKSELENIKLTTGLSEKEIFNLLEYLSDREIVNIKFR